MATQQQPGGVPLETSVQQSLEKLRGDFQSAIESAKSEALSAVSSLRSDFISHKTSVDSALASFTSLRSDVDKLIAAGSTTQAVPAPEVTAEDHEDLATQVIKQRLDFHVIERKLEIAFKKLETHGIGVLHAIEEEFKPKEAEHPPSAEGEPEPTLENPAAAPVGQ